jgi:hypothetical protein
MRASFKQLLFVLLAGIFIFTKSYALPPESTIEFLTKQVSPTYRLPENQILFAEKNIIRGLLILGALVNTNQVPQVLDDNTRAKNIVALNWALYHLAHEKKKAFKDGESYAFEQGSFSLADPHGRLYSYLISFSNAKSRSSSHLRTVKQRANIQHYGIDIQGTFIPELSDWKYSNWGSEIYILPARKSHVLFGELPQNPDILIAQRRLFLKPEDYGLRTFYGKTMHLVEFMRSQHRQRILGRANEEGEIACRERVDCEMIAIYQRFLQSVKELEIGINLSQSMVEAPKLGVRGMYEHTKRILDKIAESRGEAQIETEESKQIAEEFANFLADKGYSRAEVGYREGDEVILNEELNQNTRTEELLELCRKLEIDPREVLAEFQASAAPDAAPAAPPAPSPTGYLSYLTSPIQGAVRMFKPDYQFGDGTYAVGRALKSGTEAIVRTTIREDYQFGDFSKAFFGSGPSQK